MVEREGGLRAGPVEHQQGSGDRVVKEQRKAQEWGYQSQGEICHRGGEQLVEHEMSEKFERYHLDLQI